MSKLRKVEKITRVYDLLMKFLYSPDPQIARLREGVRGRGFLVASSAQVSALAWVLKEETQRADDFEKKMNDLENMLNVMLNEPDSPGAVALTSQEAVL